MPILYSDEFKSFYLATPNTAYVFHVGEGGFLIHDYYGGIVPPEDMAAYSLRTGNSGFSPKAAELSISPDMTPMEYSCNGTGDFRISALQIREVRGNASTDVRYVSHKIYAGKPMPQGQPATYGTETEVSTLEILTKDDVTGAEVTL